MNDNAAGQGPLERPVRPDPMRDAFEAWYSSDGKWPAAVERSSYGPGYRLGAADHAWNAWQACWPLARAAIYSAEQAQIEAPLRTEIERLRAENAALKREAHTWWAAARDAAKAERARCALRVALHSQYPIETDFDRGYDKARKDAAETLRQMPDGA